MNPKDESYTEDIFSSTLPYIELDNEIAFEKSTPDESFVEYTTSINSDADIPEDKVTLHERYIIDGVARAFGHTISIEALKLLYNNVASKTTAKSSWLNKDNDIIGDIADALGDISLVNHQTNIYYPAKLFMQCQGNHKLWTTPEDKVGKTPQDTSEYITPDHVVFSIITSLNTENFALISKNPKAIKMLYNIEKVEELITLKFKLELLNNEIHLIESIC
jgi:hypothetical protein